MYLSKKSIIKFKASAFVLVLFAILFTSCKVNGNNSFMNENISTASFDNNYNETINQILATKSIMETTIGENHNLVSNVIFAPTDNDVTVYTEEDKSDVNIWENDRVEVNDHKGYSSRFSFDGWRNEKREEYLKIDFKSMLLNIKKDDLDFTKESHPKYKNKIIKRNGLQFFTDSEGKVITDVRDYYKGDNIAIAVNRKKATTTIYAYNDVDMSYNIPLVTFPCSVNFTQTRLGEFYTTDKYDWHLMFYNHYAQYSVRFDGHILFHSVLFKKPINNTLEVDSYNGINTKVESSGCVRLRVGDAYWLHKMTKYHTLVVVYDSDVESPFERITFENINYIPATGSNAQSIYTTCDPTDPCITNKW